MVSSSQDDLVGWESLIVFFSIQTHPYGLGYRFNHPNSLLPTATGGDDAFFPPDALPYAFLYQNSSEIFASAFSFIEVFVGLLTIHVASGDTGRAALRA